MLFVLVARPNFYSMNVLFIGKTYVRMKQNEKAKEVCYYSAFHTMYSASIKARIAGLRR